MWEQADDLLRSLWNIINIWALTPTADYFRYWVTSQKATLLTIIGILGSLFGNKVTSDAGDAPKKIGETFKKPADAIGDRNGEAKLVGKGATNNEFWTSKGFTETEYYVDSNGTKWTVFKNPKTGEYSGAHRSSGQ